MIRVLIADDHKIVREGIKQILSRVPDIEVAGEAGTGQEALEKIWANHYDVVILDISLPGRNGLEILKQIRTQMPKLPVLILSMFPEEQYAIRVFRAGASGYLTKESDRDEIVQAVRWIAEGKKYVTPSLAEKLAAEFEPSSTKALHEQLSDREYHILCLIAQGKSSNDIAEELALSVKTISTHRSRVLEKMSMKSNAELTHYAVQNKLV
ncbi:MAG TPA: response regulator transcription factor [Dissulfurispiraceae bacterium]|nr:response regulator transcription factor [Dissulfurispiraceae bacterium]